MPNVSLFLSLLAIFFPKKKINPPNPVNTEDEQTGDNNGDLGF
jgi:hypothetical protein